MQPLIKTVLKRLLVRLPLDVLLAAVIYWVFGRDDIAVVVGGVWLSVI